MHRASRLLTVRDGGLRFVGLYVLFGVTWFAVTDWLLFTFVHDPWLLAVLEMLKGLLFVGVMAVVLLLLWRERATNRRQQRYFHLLAEHASDTILIYTQDHRLAYINPACKRLTGYSQTEFYTATEPFSYVHPQDQPMMVTRFNTAFAGGCGDNIEFRIVTRNNTVKRAQASWRAMREEDGTFVGIYMTLRDITGRKTTEERLRQIQLRLVQTEKMATLGRLVSDMAHELNNPLTSIIGISELLQVHNWPEEVRHDLKMIELHGRYAGRIISNLLAFARQRSPRRVPTNINDLVVRTLELRSYNLRIQNIGLDFQLAPDLPMLQLDPIQLQQVLINLVVNAEQALREPVWLAHTIYPPRLVIETTHQEGDDEPQKMVVIRVKDNGPGIPQSVRERIFEPFFTTKEEGTGLGLAISAKIVSELGGYIRAESRVGRGTTMEIFLPVVPLPTTGINDDLDLTSFDARPFIGTRVLVIDDDETNRELLLQTLARADLQIDTVASGHVAVQFIQQTDYDMVICDLPLTDMRGEVLYQALVQHMRMFDRRVIFVAGDNVCSETTAFLGKHKCQFLRKPLNTQEVLSVVHTLLANLEMPTTKLKSTAVGG